MESKEKKAQQILKEINGFDINELNLNQKSILKYLIKIIPYDNNFSVTLKSFIKDFNNPNKNILTREQLKNYIKTIKTTKIKIDLTSFSKEYSKLLKKRLENKEIKVEDLRYINPYFRNEWNDLLLKEVKNKNHNRQESDLISANTNEQIIFENKFIKKYELQKNYFRDKFNNEILSISKYNMNNKYEKELVKFAKEFLYKETIENDNYFKSILLFLSNSDNKIIFYILLLYKLNIDKEDIYYTLKSSKQYISINNPEFYNDKIKMLLNLLNEYKKYFYIHPEKNEKIKYIKEQIASILNTIKTQIQ